MNWTRITYENNIPLREGRLVEVDGQSVAIFRLPDRVLAVDNRCPHQGGPLCDGITSGTQVACPLHGWKVDLETGSVVRPTECDVKVKTFPARVYEGFIELNLL